MIWHGSPSAIRCDLQSCVSSNLARILALTSRRPAEQPFSRVLLFPASAISERFSWKRILDEMSSLCVFRSSRSGKHGEDNTHSQPHACVCPTPCSPTSDADGGDRPCAPKVTAPHRNRDSLQFTSPLIGRVQFAQIIGQQNGNIFKKRKLPPLSPSVFPKPNRTSWLS